MLGQLAPSQMGVAALAIEMEEPHYPCWQGCCVHGPPGRVIDPVLKLGSGVHVSRRAISSDVATASPMRARWRSGELDLLGYQT